MSEFLTDGPSTASTTVLFAHGAGGAMDTPFMTTVAAALGRHGVRVCRFDFPYMVRARREGKRRPPDRMPVLEEAFRERVTAVRPRKGRLVLMGKSMGGRVASHIADSVDADGLVCLGYPFHPPSRPEKRRTAHLSGLRTATLIVQGTSDPFGTPNDVAGYALSPSIRLHWIEAGNHDLVMPKKLGGDRDAGWRDVAGVVAAFLDAQSAQAACTGGPDARG